MNKAIPYAAAALAVFLLWYSLDAHQKTSQALAREQLLQQQVAEMQQQVTELEQQVAALELQLEQTQKETVSGVVEEAQSSLKQGLRSMLDAAGQEFDRLQEILDETLDEWEQEQQQHEQGAPGTEPGGEADQGQLYNSKN